MDSKHVGIMAILSASIMWAVEPILAKLSYQNSDFIHTSGIRAIFVTLTAFIYIAFSDKKNFFINKKQFPPLIYIAIAGTIFADFIYFFALTKIPVVNAVLIGHMQPIFIILLGFFMLKDDRLTKFDFIGIFLMILSGMLVTTKSAQNFMLLKFGTFGDLMVLMATISWDTTAIVARKYLRKMNAGSITFYRFLFASIFFIFYLEITSDIKISNAYQIIVGIVVGIGTIFYYEGLKKIKAAQVSAIEL
ncbi:MAG TPA: DMT family transporter, partial [Thermoplasmata archaeon]|nr:DMT family transporter [Thermoplasmata archaeon]